jgi:uncharacterized metal-binding protein YceD (DUF177 family)
VTVIPEFSRKLAVERIGPGGLVQTLEATAAEREALAARLRVPAVLALAATFRLTRGQAGRIEAAAHLSGRLVRECVVTLEPFETDIAEDFTVAFVPEALLSDSIELEGEDEIPYAGGVIDLGEAVAEQVALSLDPYPKRPGAILPEEAAEPPESPFAALARRGRAH